ncbi:putative RNA recognition motif domain, nucleotide-binding alpha-beta plait domain superfamily [Helianthus annuus]|nr:putative RNA recognition motif domain, nucleotide-binding alpha-beta plait domain superfamily [Helianthus annuus]KAJ0563890.1 putative RNA recognition motif domain, nucleotide-binding alpha-beta plait domain superfamily [Helianthus annuus]KAJ0731965.1 putative RNA recognition motif domain, nucleotide-binding alpha-beta plait domain superfamily [Helianthus annuus]KAJ0905568.1 putative RNA recognition motif domain, nucleotide-binding alpha-beta plait domain superfamily [Helianthus annuus]KAJ09
MDGNTTKLFISNLPDGSTPWELRKCLENFGEISGTFVAKKRDKFGNRFGFASFKNVSDRQELLNSLRGVKMGDNRLKINIARFAMENAGFNPQPRTEGKVPKPGSAGVNENLRQFNVRDGRSFRDVVGSSFRGGDMGTDSGGLCGGVGFAGEKSVVVPDRTNAFQEWIGKAVVGRTVDIETLVDFHRLMRIAKIAYYRIHYLGGLSILVSFVDEEAAGLFLESQRVWGPWFSKLDPWKGQTLPLERVAWLKVSGVPLHLVDPDVLVLIGELYGKVIYTPKLLEAEQDLSVFKIAVLVGEDPRIRESVNLKWKYRCFRVWVEEDQEIWEPDCLVKEIGDSSEGGSELQSSPVGILASPGVVGAEGSEKADSRGVLEESPLGNFGVPHNEVPMHEDHACPGGGCTSGNVGPDREMGGFSSAVPEVGSRAGDQESGPSFFGFHSQPNSYAVKAPRKVKLGPKCRMGRPHGPGGSPISDQRPRKRSRNDENEELGWRGALI